MLVSILYDKHFMVVQRTKLGFVLSSFFVDTLNTLLIKVEFKTICSLYCFRDCDCDKIFPVSFQNILTQLPIQWNLLIIINVCLQNMITRLPRLFSWLLSLLACFWDIILAVSFQNMFTRVPSQWNLFSY